MSSEKPRAGTQNDQVLCPRCGAENFSFAAFCISCGEPLGDDIGESDLAAFGPEEALSGGEISANAPRQPRWLLETALGLVLLLAVVGYSLYRWQLSNGQSAAYRAGQAAIKARDWDRAAASLARAGDILDAPQERDLVRTRVDARDRAYALAVEAEGRRDFAAALAAYRQVDTIQPSYRGVEQRIARVTNQAFETGLDGLVYLAGSGPAPGLYFLGAGETPVRLPGSDENSLVRAVSPDGPALVYDRPSRIEDYYTLPGTHLSAISDPPGPGKSERVPVLARLVGGRLTYAPLSQLDPYGSGIFAPGGLWWFSFENGRPVTAYLPFPGGPVGTPSAQVTRLAGVVPQERVVAVDPEHGRVVIARLNGRPPGDYWESTLYLAGAEGRGARPLQTMPGRVTGASISGDGRWLIYETFQNTANIERTIWALPLPTGSTVASELPAALELASVAWTVAHPDAAVGAALLPPAGGKIRVAVSHRDGSSRSIEVFDLDGGGSRTLWRGPAGNAPVDLSPASFAPDGGAVAFRDEDGGPSSLVVAATSPGAGAATSVPLRALPTQAVRVSFAPGGEYLLASVLQDAEAGQDSSQVVYVAGTPNGRPGAPKLLVTARLPRSYALPPMALPPDSPLLVYVDPGGDLRATLLDASADRLVSRGVGAVWSLRGTR